MHCEFIASSHGWSQRVPSPHSRTTAPSSVQTSLLFLWAETAGMGLPLMAGSLPPPSGGWGRHHPRAQLAAHCTS